MITGTLKQPQEEFEEIRTVKNCPFSFDNTERVLLIDADSIVFYATYFPEDSIMFFPDEDSQLEEAKFRVRNKLQEIQLNVEQYYNIIKTLIFVKGKNNFRYKIFPEYKANRHKTERNPLIDIILQYMIDELGAIPSHNGEADDYIIDSMLSCKGHCVVSAIDKDVLYHCPDVPFYDYRSHDDVMGEWKFISEKESRLARASQMIIGDVTDGIIGCKGMGKAYCQKNLHKDMTDYQFIKNILIAYLKSNKNDNLEAKRQIRLFYNILKLHTLEELEKLIK